MRFTSIALLMLTCLGCDRGLAVGDPCEPEGDWCCLESVHVECVDGFIKQAHPDLKESCICTTHEPGYRPCT